MRCLVDNAKGGWVVMVGNRARAAMKEEVVVDPSWGGECTLCIWAVAGAGGDILTRVMPSQGTHISRNPIIAIEGGLLTKDGSTPQVCHWYVTAIACTGTPGVNAPILKSITCRQGLPPE